MKILQINNVYDFGSTGKITRDIHHGLLDKGYESVVYYGRRYKTDDPSVYKICSELYGKAQNGLYQFTGIQFGGCILSTHRLLKAIRREKPDVVHLQCLNGHFVNIYRLLEYLKETNTPTVLTLHAEFMYTGGCSHSIDCNQWKSQDGCGHPVCPLYRKELKSRLGDKSSVMWRRMKQAFNGFDNLIVVSVSPWLMKRAQMSSILGRYEHEVIYNGLETSIFHSYPEREMMELKAQYGYLTNDRIVFHASPSFDNNIDNLKGGYYVLQLAERMQDTKFLIAGRYDPSLQVPKNVKLLGNITDKTLLAKLYSMSNVTLLTSKRETFSMVCAESLCCGTPVVGFKAGAPEMIAISEYSQFCEFGEIDRLETILKVWVGKDKPIEISEKGRAIYDSEKMVQDYIRIYQKILSIEKVCSGR